jgi:hypothetical protein
MRRSVVITSLYPLIGATLTLALVGVIVLCAGCGQAIGSSNSPQVGMPSSPTPTQSVQAGQPTQGQVTLTLDKQRYAMGDTIAVTIHNGLSTTIWAADHQTSCTVLTAERQQDGQWHAVGDCRLMTPTVLMPFSAGSATVQQLFGMGWPSGRYRVTLTYTGGDEGTGGPGGIAHSAEFTIA